MPSETKKKLTASYAFIQGFYWMSFAVVMGFVSVYLLDSGFTNTQIGMIIAVSGMISAVLQPAIASWADRRESLSLKQIVFLLTLLLLFLSGVLLLFHRKFQMLTGLCYGSCIIILQLLLPLVNSLGMESINQGRRLNFGVARGMGSVAYAIAAYVLGIIVAETGAVSVPVCMVLIYGLLLVSLYRFPFRKTERTLERTGGQVSASPADFFRRYRRFGIVLIGWVFLYISHIFLNSFTFQIVESKGGGSPEMGFAMALAAVLELPTLFLFGYMIKKVRCDIWFRISGIFFMLKSLGTLLAPNIAVFCLVQVFQMFGWALITVASVYYVNAVMEEQDVIKGQAYMTMTYTIGSVLGALIGGSLIDRAGVDFMLGFSTVSAFAGMLIVLLATQKTEAKTREKRLEG